MTRLKKFAAIALLSALFVTGCATTQEGGSGNKQTAGTLIGGIAGALIGNQIGSGSGRTVATLAGAIAGGALGNWIGSKLDEKDRQELAASTQKALTTGRSETWHSDHSGATATIHPVSSRTVTQQATVRHSAEIQQVQDLTVINEPWQAAKSANLRAGPSTASAKVGGLAPGQSFTALGRTHNNWIAVGRKGITVGYVYGPLVEPVAVAHTDQATDLDKISVTQAKSQGFDLDTLEPAKPVVEKVPVQTTCRKLKYDVTTSKGSQSKTVDACQGTDGAWQLG